MRRIGIGSSIVGRDFVGIVKQMLAASHVEIVIGYVRWKNIAGSVIFPRAGCRKQI